MKPELIALISNCQFLSNWKKVSICFQAAGEASSRWGSAASDKKRPFPIFDAMLAQTINPSQADYQLLAYIV